MVTVVYDSVYGSTKQYAQQLANLIDAELLELNTASNQAHLDLLAQDTSPMVVLAPVHGPACSAAAFVARHDFGARPVAVAAVGMTLLELARAKDQLSGPLAQKPQIQRFYLPGRLNYSELSTQHAMIMKTMVAALKVKPLKSDNEKAIIDGYNQDVDRVDFSELDPLVEWVQRNS